MTLRLANWLGSRFGWCWAHSPTQSSRGLRMRLTSRCCYREVRWLQARRLQMKGMEKRQRTAAVQNADALFWPPPSARFLDCGGPLPLSHARGLAFRREERGQGAIEGVGDGAQHLGFGFLDDPIGGHRLSAGV